MAGDKDRVIFYCVPDDIGAQAHFWDGETGFLCRPPKGSVQVERVCCSQHHHVADKKNARP
jgi:hypothetical protein